MSLSDIIGKEPTIATPPANVLANSPEEWESKFRFHVATYVALPDVESRWNAILNNLLKGKSATGLIYADTGYGKTSTGLSLWHHAELQGIVAVPPFIWNNLADMLTATHGWVCHRLRDRRPELIPDLDWQHRTVVEVDEQILAQRMVHEEGLTSEQARRTIARLKAEGRLLDALSPLQLLNYLRFATKTLLKSDYKGLLILPDEFELFKNKLDTEQNFKDLKDFIFGIHGAEKLPIGCVVFTYRRTHADINRRARHILARFTKPEGGLIDLENFYGVSGFAKHLWDKLADSCKLSPSERSAIDEDVLDALGQFLRHSRARDLMSGPRSVVQTFNCATRHYTQHNRPYSLFDFCKDYLSGNITYGSQETETAQSYNRIMELLDGNNAEEQKLVELLCVHPEGIPKEIFLKHGISNSVIKTVVQNLLRQQYAINKITGPTLACYRDDLLGVDKLNEILSLLQDSFEPQKHEVHLGAIRAFNKHVLPTIFTMKKGSEGWVFTNEMPENLGHHYTRDLKGTILRQYPDRTLTVNIQVKTERSAATVRQHPNGTLGLDIGEETVSTSSSTGSSLRTLFILDTTDNADNRCSVDHNGLVCRFNMQMSINPQEIPEEIGKLGELFLPELITPLLLLSILDFFDKQSTIEIVERENQEGEVNFLKERILTELIRFFFSPGVKTEAIFDPPELSEDFAVVPVGKTFVESALKILIPKQFPDYSAIAVSKGWQGRLGMYRTILQIQNTLGIKRGTEPIKTRNQSIPELFNMMQMTAFQNFYNGAGQNLLRIDEINSSGNTVANGISPQNNSKQVAVYLTLHPLEERLVEQLENSSRAITIDAKNVNAVELPDVYQQASKIGYLEEEIDALIETLQARGIADRKTVAGTEHLYLVETFINLAEQKEKLESLENSVDLAKSNGFTFQCKDLASAQALTHTIGIENDEVMKDELRQKLNSAEEHLKNKCAEWVKTEHGSLNKKVHELETLHLQVPKILDQQTGHPVTDFSQILFHNIQPEVKSDYTDISNEIRNIQGQIGETCNREIRTYESNLTPQNAIETATRLRQIRSRVDTDINRLNQKGTDAQELNRLFEHWRALAHQIEGDIQLIGNSLADPAVQNLIERLDTVQRDTRQHLADNRKTLKDVLSSHEHFKTQVEAIKTEFDQLLRGKTDAFIAYQDQIVQQLRDLPGPSLQRVDFNPVDSDGCYRKVRENAVDKLRDVIDDVQTEGNQRQRELLKPIKVFKVPEPLRAKAIQLSEDLKQLANELQGIGREFTVEEVNQKLSEWVEQLVLKIEEGQAISESRKQIERELDKLAPTPSSRPQRLLNELTPQQGTDFTELTVRLLGDGTFNSTKEILESLEELYQANVINLTVHRK